MEISKPRKRDKTRTYRKIRKGKIRDCFNVTVGFECFRSSAVVNKDRERGN